MSDHVLNPSLYRALRTLGPVRVEKRGMTAVMSRPVLDLTTNRERTRWVSGGEHYMACCPYCNDRRNHLAVGYLYGQIDPRTGEPMVHLAHCYHGCLSDPANRDDLRHHLTRLASTRLDLSVGAAAVFDHDSSPSCGDDWVEAPPPRGFQLLSDLPSGHVARTYMASRGFCSDFLGRTYGVGYCDDAGRDAPFWARNRILVPVRRLGVTVCWQGRELSTHTVGSPRKYVFNNGARAGELLYNLDGAVGRRLVLVEGVIDAWRVGPGGVARFNDGIREQQVSLLVRWHMDHPAGVVVVLADPGDAALGSARRVVNRVRDARVPCVLADQLPGGLDPGDSSAESVHAAIVRAELKARSRHTYT